MARRPKSAVKEYDPLEYLDRGKDKTPRTFEESLEQTRDPGRRVRPDGR